MAQNITLLGASYPDVPAVNLPKTGGGTAKFTDVTDTTATASDVAQGKAFYDASGVLTQGTASGGGGGGGSASANDVSFRDYDGTIVASYSASDFANLSALPSNPSHSGLVAQGWNWSLEDAQSYVAKHGKLEIGQMYITESGDTEIDVVFPDMTRLSPIMTIAVNGTIAIDWGDNTAPDTVTGTSLASRKAVPHGYATTGNYTIVIHAVSGSFTFYGNTSSNANYTLLRKNTTSTQNYIYANTIRAIRLGSGITSIHTRGLAYCYSLETITIPQSVTDIGTYTFQSCYSLASINIPDGVTSIGTYAFQNCYSLASINIPDGVTSIEISAFYNCYSLASINIPDGVTSIGSSAFYGCYSLASINIPDGATNIASSEFGNCCSLASINIPDGVTNIGNNAFSGCCSLASLIIPDSITAIAATAFQGCYGMAEYHFLSTIPPTLANANAFTSIVSDCIIYVPEGSLEAYQTATNWSTYTSYMREEGT